MKFSRFKNPFYLLHFKISFNMKLVTVNISGATEAFQSYKKQVYIGLFVLCLLFSIFLAIPATTYSDIVTGRQEGMFCIMMNLGYGLFQYI